MSMNGMIEGLRKLHGGEFDSALKRWLELERGSAESAEARAEAAYLAVAHWGALDRLGAGDSPILPSDVTAERLLSLAVSAMEHVSQSRLCEAAREILDSGAPPDGRMDMIDSLMAIRDLHQCALDRVRSIAGEHPGMENPLMESFLSAFEAMDGFDSFMEEEHPELVPAVALSFSTLLDCISSAGGRASGWWMNTVGAAANASLVGARWAAMPDSGLHRIRIRVPSSPTGSAATNTAVAGSSVRCEKCVGGMNVRFMYDVDSDGLAHVEIAGDRGSLPAGFDLARGALLSGSRAVALFVLHSGCDRIQPVPGFDEVQLLVERHAVMPHPMPVLRVMQAESPCSHAIAAATAASQASRSYVSDRTPDGLTVLLDVMPDGSAEAVVLDSEEELTRELDGFEIIVNTEDGSTAQAVIERGTASVVLRRPPVTLELHER